MTTVYVLHAVRFDECVAESHGRLFRNLLRNMFWLPLRVVVQDACIVTTSPHKLGVLWYSL